MQTDTQQTNTASKDERQLVTFILQEEELGFDIMSVQEIIRPPKMAKVPRTPSYVEGIANLRGVVLPIIDMRTRFGMERAEETDRTRVLVVDVNGVKTGLRVDRVRQVTRVQHRDIEAPPPTIRGMTANYVEGVVKLDNGRRIIMTLNASQVCQIGIVEENVPPGSTAHEGEMLRDPGPSAKAVDKRDDIQQMVTFRIAKEEFGFPMERVREILRLETPRRVPDVPDHVVGVLTLRGQILPIVDLRRLLQQRSMAEDFAGACSEVRKGYEDWMAQCQSTVAANEYGRVDLGVAERLRGWVADTNSSSQVLMETLSVIRGCNARVLKQLQSKAPASETSVSMAGVVEALRQFEEQIPTSVQEDQRIIVVDAGGYIVGLVVDHVKEVMNISKNLIEPAPQIGSSSVELSGVAKLNDGSRLIMLLDIAKLLPDQQLPELRETVAKSSPTAAMASAQAASVEPGGKGGLRTGELQVVTFLLGGEEYGIPLSQIQEIDRLSKITKVPKAARFIEGVTNLRGEVVPVLDIRKRFDLELKTADDRTRIIIVEIGGVKTGLVVDSVREVLNLPNKDIAPPPDAIHGGVDQQFIFGIGKVESGKRLIVLLDVQKILSNEDQGKLTEIAG